MKKGISLKFDVLLLNIFFEPYSRMTHMIQIILGWHETGKGLLLTFSGISGILISSMPDFCFRSVSVCFRTDCRKILFVGRLSI